MTPPTIAYTLSVRIPAAPDDPQGVRRLRAVLKALLRSHGLRCVGAVPAVASDPPAAPQGPPGEPQPPVSAGTCGIHRRTFL